MGNYRSSSGAFVVSPYSLNSDKEIVPELPVHCPKCSGESCTIVVDHLRERKTGPQIPLYVMRCKTHKIGFTLYPYGCYPYSRHTLAPVDMEGNSLTNSYPNDSLFIGTLFEAAIDAGNGIPWKSASDVDSLKPRFPTQMRHMWRATILLGVASGMEKSLREEIAQLLTLPGQLLNDTSDQIVLSTCGYRCWGKKICTLLRHIPAGTLFERLVEVGANAGLWPQPLFLINNMLQHSPFHRVRMRGSPKKKGDH